MSAFDKRDRADRRNSPDSFSGGKWTHRENDGDRLMYVAHGRGYVMARKVRAMPFVLSERAWLALPLFEVTTNAD